MLIDYVLNVQARQRLQKVIDASLLDKFADWLADLPTIATQQSTVTSTLRRVL
jgi:hypothetical protein